MSKFKKITTLFLSVIMLFSFGCCNSETGEQNSTPAIEKGVDDMADVWAVSGSQKVMASQSVEKYAAYKQDAVQIDAVKNEYENGQIVVTAKKDVEFSVELSDLTLDSNKNVKISKDNFKVYIEKYVYVPRNANQNGEPVGDYPDAIIPQKEAIDYGENKVVAGENGTAWLEFYIPKNVKAGSYSGVATVTVNDGATQIPVRLNVYDYTLSDETTSKSIFLFHKSVVEDFEMDCSQEMLDLYHQFFADHRVSGLQLVDSSMEAYVDKACEWAQKGMSTIAVKSAPITGLQYKTFDADAFVDCIVKFAQRSLVDKTNYVSKLAFYNSNIDEPFFLPRADGIVPFQIERFDTCLEMAKSKLMADSAFSTKFGQEIIASVDDIPHVITDYYEQDQHRINGPLKNADGSLFSYDGTNVVLCPKPNGLGSKEERANYDQFNAKWIYTCNDPMYPYPTYHIDAHLIDAMALGWMMGEYDCVGNLYWNAFLHYDLNNNPVDNPFEEPIRTSGVNGDGWLFYPGKQFGIEGPISSVRFEAIRDGNEDYELIQDIKAKYAAVGADASEILSIITSSVYAGTSMIGNSNSFEQARISLLKLAEAATSECGLIINNVVYNAGAFEAGLYDFTITVNEGVSLYSDGQLLTANSDGAYRIQKMLSENVNSLNLIAKINRAEADFSLYLGGKALTLATNEFTSGMFSGAVASTALEQDGWYNVAIGATTDSTEVIIKTPFFDNIGSTTKDCKFYLYNDLTNEIDYKIYVNYSGFGKVEVMSGKLKSGENVISLSMFSSVNWKSRKSVKSIEFEFNGESVKFGNVFIYNK